VLVLECWCVRGSDATTGASASIGAVNGDMVFIEPKRKLPPQGGRTLKGRGKKRFAATFYIPTTLVAAASQTSHCRCVDL
jgi:hypothetical protein